MFRVTVEKVQDPMEPGKYHSYSEVYQQIVPNVSLGELVRVLNPMDNSECKGCPENTKSSKDLAILATCVVGRVLRRLDECPGFKTWWSSLPSEGRGPLQDELNVTAFHEINRFHEIDQ